MPRGSIAISRRGGGGGARLAHAQQDIRFGDVVRQLEEDQPLVGCFQSITNNCALDGLCRLKARLRTAERAFLADLDRATLADIALPEA